MCAFTDQLFKVIKNLFGRTPDGSHRESPIDIEKSQSNRVENAGKASADRKQNSASRRVA
jgi:hypothetical protein